MKKKMSTENTTVKKKVKSSETKEKESTGVKLGSVDIEAVKEDKSEEEQRKANRSDNPYFKAPQGWSHLFVLPPTSKAMMGFPWVKMLKHNNMGPNGDQWGSCMRKSAKEPREKCEGCVHVTNLFNKSKAFEKANKKESALKYKNLAKKQIVREQPRLQILDVSGCYDENSGVFEDEFPECFGENVGATEKNKYKKCKSCPMLDSCKKGVQNWDVNFAAYESLQSQLIDKKKDVCNPAKAYPMRLKRTGEGQMGTKYVVEWVEKPLKIPDHVVAFIERRAIDLTKAIKPATEEQMMKMLSGGNVKADDDEAPVKKKKTEEKVMKNKFKKTKISPEAKQAMMDKLKNKSAEKHKKVKS